jgi:uridine phosphorylase
MIFRFCGRNETTGAITVDIQYPILEFDATPEAVLEPTKVIKDRGLPEHCVLCFFYDVMAGLKQDSRVEAVLPIKSEMGEHPVYVLSVEGQKLAACHVGLGAPLAGAMLEELIARGGRKFIACGVAAVLNRNIVSNQVVVPSTAIRDEGTSYHYLPPAREVGAHPSAVSAIEAVLKKRQCPYIVGKTWTTDAIFRETAPKIKARKSEGCVTVEMEAAAFFAVAQFRQVVFGQILYAGDDVSGIEWDPRDFFKRGPIREQIFWLAAEACLQL